jgi:hypothetical protein
LLFKFNNLFLKIEERLGILEAKLSDLKANEESGKSTIYFSYAILIILLIFALYMFATGK